MIKEKLSPPASPVRASLFNLVVYAPDKRRANYLQLLIEAFVEKFPCSLLVIECDESKGKDYLEVTKSNLSFNSTSSNPITCDLISLKLSKNLLDRVHFLIIPHFVPDLPVYLLWGENPIQESTLLPQLLPVATRLIFDLDCLESLRSLNQEMIKQLANFPVEIMDINWALISPWREAFFQIFDTSERIQVLNSSRSLKIIYNNHGAKWTDHTEIMSLYLQAWLAARLDWKLQNININQDKWEAYYSKDDKIIQVSLEPHSQENLSSGAIIQIEIISYENHFCLIAQKPKLSLISIYLSTSEQCDLPFTLPLPNLKRGFSFLKEIFYNQMSEHYFQMLKVFSQISEK